MDVFYLLTKECMRRGLSSKTIVTYKECLRQFFKNCKKDPREIRKSDIKEYLNCLIEKGFCGNTINVYHNSLRFFFEEIMCRSLLLNIKYSKIPKELPTVLIKEEITKLFNAINNKKHSLMIKLMYSAGLRVSEVVNLKVKDFEFESDYGWVRKGKGNKDRMFIVAENMKKELTDFISSENKTYEDYVFTGRDNYHLSQRSVQEIVKSAAKNAGIKKNVHCHTLRHSFATHLIGDGYSVGDVQMLLGHNSPQTTMRYVHMASPRMINIRSPYDNLDKKEL